MINVTNDTKNAFISGRYRNNYVIVFRSDSGGKLLEIDNNNIVAESCDFNESVCSSSDLRFGVMEANSFSFECFSTNAKELEICRPFLNRKIEVYIYSENTEERIQLGVFVIKSVSKDSKNGIIKISSYNEANKEALEENIAELGRYICEYMDEGYNGSDRPASWFFLEQALFKYKGLAYEKGRDTTYTVSAPETGKLTKEFYDGYKEFVIARRSSSTYEYNLRVHFRTYQVNFNSDNEEYVRLNVKRDISDSVKMLNNSLLNMLWNDPNLENYGAFKYKETITGYTLYLNAKDALRNDYFKFPYNKDEEGKPNGFQIEYLRGCVMFGYYDENNNSRIFYETKYLDDELDFSTLYHKKKDALVFFVIPYKYEISSTYNSVEVREITPSRFYEYATADISDVSLIGSKQVPYEFYTQTEYTLRDIVEGVNELECVFTKTNKTTNNIQKITLERNALFPRTTLYPSNTLYPSGERVTTTPVMYKDLIYEEDMVRNIRNLVINYRTATQEHVEVLEVNADGTDDYIVQGNPCLNGSYWGSALIRELGQDMVQKLRPYTWIPFDMECIGLPYVEAGDIIEIQTEEGTIETQILSRNLKGIQNLSDNMKNGSVIYY